MKTKCTGIEVYYYLGTWCCVLNYLLIIFLLVVESRCTYTHTRFPLVIFEYAPLSEFLKIARFSVLYANSLFSHLPRRIRRAPDKFFFFFGVRFCMYLNSRGAYIHDLYFECMTRREYMSDVCVCYVCVMCGVRCSAYTVLYSFLDLTYIVSRKEKNYFGNKLMYYT